MAEARAEVQAEACEAWVEEVKGRKVMTRSRLLSPDGVTCSDGTALFLQLTAEQFGMAKMKAEGASKE